MLIGTTTPELASPRTSSAALHHAGQAAIRGHWGELLQGGFRDQDGAIVRGLVTLRSPLFQAWARFEPRSGPLVTCTPVGCSKAIRAAEKTLSYLGITNQGGHLTLHNDAPVGIGAGSSTTDVVATIIAVSNACRHRLSELEVAHLAIEAEQAADPIMLRPCPEVLFAHRHGTVLERFSGWLPSLHVLGFTTGAPVDTVLLPLAQYDHTQIDEFECLRARVRRAIALRDRCELGAVATRSTIINDAYLPKPSLALILDLVREVGALGLSVSHSGSVIGLLFDPVSDGVRRARPVLAEAGFTQTWTFITGWPG